jgi:hypothetical protein
MTISWLPGMTAVIPGSVTVVPSVTSNVIITGSRAPIVITFVP